MRGSTTGSETRKGNNNLDLRRNITESRPVEKRILRGNDSLTWKERMARVTQGRYSPRRVAHGDKVADVCEDYIIFLACWKTRSVGGLIVVRTRNDSRDNLARFRCVRLNSVALGDHVRACVPVNQQRKVFHNCSFLTKELTIALEIHILAKNKYANAKSGIPSPKSTILKIEY